MERTFDMGGRRNYRALPQDEKDAIDFINWATEEGHRREIGPRKDFAAHAARYLRRTNPTKFDMAIHSWKTGGAGNVYSALLTMAEQA